MGRIGGLVVQVANTDPQTLFGMVAIPGGPVRNSRCVGLTLTSVSRVGWGLGHHRPRMRQTGVNWLVCPMESGGIPRQSPCVLLACLVWYNGAVVLGPSSPRASPSGLPCHRDSTKFLAWRWAWGKGRYGPVKRVHLAFAVIRVADGVARSERKVSSLANPFRGLGGGVRGRGEYPSKGVEKFLPFGIDLSVSLA
jgi:hypothetical protein